MVKYSSLNERIYAFLIDIIFISGLSFIFGLIASSFFMFIPLTETFFFKKGLYVILVIIFLWLYYAILESSKKQATIGKMIIGLKVTDLKFKRINFSQASKRFFFKLLSFKITLNNKGQAYHDKLSKCFVIRE
ncbi:MAG: RDD family protein [Candidatus Nanoarchaeia archaeon]|nr:RDD family protein [Candidatus Nanoarchaeia archaeon]MDD5054270.1 RDD family protein [Candidatus Nanoarchaeia archaeon]